MIIFSVKKVLLIVFISLFFVSLVFNAWLGYQLLSTINIYEAQEMNIKILDFTDMFVEKILMADKEIDFDTRLALESTVRNLGDQQIFDQWQRFTQAETKEGASTEAKLLLNLLVKKIKAHN